MAFSLMQQAQEAIKKRVPTVSPSQLVWHDVFGYVQLLYSRPFGARTAIAAVQLNGNQGGEVQQDAIPT